MATIGFIGLGNMGGPMAINLIKAGHSLKVFDLSSQALKTLSEAGGQAVASANEAVKDVEIAISMLPASAHVEGLYLGNESFSGILADLSPSTLVIDCSTIAPDSARKVARALADRGVEMIDAPVSGGTAGAQNATLTFIVGGSTKALEKARPILAQMGKNIFHAGEHGAGQVAKICNNMLLAIHMIGSSEALALGMANGLDPAVLSDIMKQSSGNNWSLQVYNPVPGVMDTVPASKQYQGGFMVDLMAKDLGLALEAALSSKTSTPLGSLARSLYAAHSSLGHGELDFSSIIKLIQNK